MIKCMVMRENLENTEQCKKKTEIRVPIIRWGYFLLTFKKIGHTNIKTRDRAMFVDVLYVDFHKVLFHELFSKVLNLLTNMTLMST